MSSDMILKGGLGEKDHAEIEEIKRQIHEEKERALFANTEHPHDFIGKTKRKTGRRPRLIVKILQTCAELCDNQGNVDIDELIRWLGADPDYRNDRNNITSTISYMKSQPGWVYNIRYRRPGRQPPRADKCQATRASS